MTRAENTTRPEPPQESGDRGTRARWVVAAFVLALVLRGIGAWYEGAAQVQEIRYISIARGILSGAGFVGLDNRFPDIIQPPLFPLILSGVFLLPGTDLFLARAFSALMGALLVWPTAGIARRLFGPQAGYRAAFLVAVYPFMIHMSSAAITESTFTLPICLAFLLIWQGLETKDRRPLRHAAAGLLIGLSYLTRPEGLTYLVMTVVILTVFSAARHRGWSAWARSLALLLAGFALVASPYLLWVHSRTGQWLVAPKAVLVEVHHTLIQEGQSHGWREPYGSLLFFERVKFGLNEDATAIRSHEEFDDAKVGLSEGLLVDDEGRVAIASPGRAARMVLKNLAYLYHETIKYGFVMPSILMMLAGVGLVSRRWRGPFRRSALLVVAYFVASFSFLLTHVESRFLFSAMPFLIPWMAEGWWRAEVWCLATISVQRARAAAVLRRLVPVALGAAVLLLTVVHVIPSIRQTSRLWTEHREIGLWMKDQGVEGKVMAAAPIVSYYAGLEYVVLPYAELPAVVAYARNTSAAYLIADRAEIPTFRPQLTSLLVPARSHPGLELIHSLHEGTRHAIYVYRVLPEGSASD